MLNLQKIIKENSDWEDRLLNAPFNLHIQKTNLANGDSYVLFKYDQRKSNLSIPLVQEARGVILRISPDRTSRIVRFFTKKFFNFNEPLAAKIDYSSCEATLKWDGTLVSLWWDEGVWNISTLGNIDIYDAPLGSGGIKTFGDLFYKAKQTCRFDFEKLDKRYCYNLELCAPENQICILYDNYYLIHINTVDLSTLEEIDYDMGLPKPRRYKLNSKDEYEALVRTFDKSQEGIVIKDKFGNRVKMKTELYFNLHTMACNGQVNKLRAMELILKKDTDEFLSYFPKQRDYIESVEKEYNAAVHDAFEINNKVNEWKGANPAAARKEFVEYVDSEFPKKKGIAFCCYDGKFIMYFEDKYNAALADKSGGELKNFMHFLQMEVG